MALGSDPQPENDAVSGLGYTGLSVLYDLDNSGSLVGRVDGDGIKDVSLATDESGERISSFTRLPLRPDR